jgi:hypothetical protein
MKNKMESKRLEQWTIDAECQNKMESKGLEQWTIDAECQPANH